jgi:exopolyphosphatase / guanosine-5'-triphosphate,3'-diphosphate pyrophosphatase
MRLVATEACRRARNAKRLHPAGAARDRPALEIIAPEEEARLAVISCAPLVNPSTEQLLVVDIGGGSTELVWIDLSRRAAWVDRPRAIMRLHMGASRAGRGGRSRRRGWWTGSRCRSGWRR